MEVSTEMPVVSLNMYLTLTFAVVVLFLGEYLKNKIAFLKKFCIPQWKISILMLLSEKRKVLNQ